MSVQRYQANFERIEEKVLASWKDIPAAIAGDSMNRQQVMAARIKPLAPGMRLVGQARCVDAVEGDNAAIHAAVSLVEPGEVLVINGGGMENRAVWGGILAALARRRKIAGVVLDGAVRDITELKEGDLPVFAVAASPAGPSKGWGGTIDGTIACGGVAVEPGDLIVGDEDGVVVVPLARHAEVLKTARERLKFEASVLERLEKGEDTSSIFGIPEITDLSP